MSGGRTVGEIDAADGTDRAADNIDFRLTGGAENPVFSGVQDFGAAEALGRENNGTYVVEDFGEIHAISLLNLLTSFLFSLTFIRGASHKFSKS